MNFTEEQAQILLDAAIAQEQAIIEQKKAIAKQEQFNAYLAEKLEKIEALLIATQDELIRSRKRENALRKLISV